MFYGCCTVVAQFVAASADQNVVNFTKIFVSCSSNQSLLVPNQFQAVPACSRFVDYEKWTCFKNLNERYMISISQIFTLHLGSVPL